LLLHYLQDAEAEVTIDIGQIGTAEFFAASPTSIGNVT